MRSSTLYLPDGLFTSCANSELDFCLKAAEQHELFWKKEKKTHTVPISCEQFFSEFLGRGNK